MSRIYNTGMVVRNVAYGNVDVKGLSFTEYLHIYTAANFYDVYLDAPTPRENLSTLPEGRYMCMAAHWGLLPTFWRPVSASTETVR